MIGNNIKEETLFRELLEEGGVLDERLETHGVDTYAERSYIMSTLTTPEAIHYLLALSVEERNENLVAGQEALNEKNIGKGSKPITLTREDVSNNHHMVQELKTGMISVAFDVAQAIGTDTRAERTVKLPEENSRTELGHAIARLIRKGETHTKIQELFSDSVTPLHRVQENLPESD